MRIVVSDKRGGMQNAYRHRYGPTAARLRLAAGFIPEKPSCKNLLSYLSPLTSNQLVSGDTIRRDIRGETGFLAAIDSMNVKQWPSTAISIVQRLSNPDDTEAWSGFCTTYAPLMLRRCHKLRIQSSDAEDIVQNVLMRVVRYGLDYDPDKGRFRGWLGKLLRQCIHNHVKTGKNVPRELAEDTAGKVDAGWTADFNAHVLKTAMDKIRNRYDGSQWKAFELTWIEAHKPSEVAKALEKSVTWVYKATCLIRQDLLQAVRDITDDEPMVG